MLRPVPRISSGSYYINHEKDKFLLACPIEAFKPECRDKIPEIFEKKGASTYVATFDRNNESVSIEAFTKAISTLNNYNEISEALESYILRETPRPRMY